MKLPPKNSRGHIILQALLAEPATIYQGIERHSLLETTEGVIRNIYERLELEECVVRTGMIYTVTIKARTKLAPVDAAMDVSEDEECATAPAYRGNWQGPALSASTARRAGAAFGLGWIRP